MNRYAQQAVTPLLSDSENAILQLLANDADRNAVIEACERLKERTAGRDASALRDVINILRNWN